MDSILAGGCFGRWGHDSVVCLVFCALLCLHLRRSDARDTPGHSDAASLSPPFLVLVCGLHFGALAAWQFRAHSADVHRL